MSKVGLLKNGTFITTIPRLMAQAYELTDNHRLRWSYIHKDGRVTGFIVKKELIPCKEAMVNEPNTLQSNEV